MLEAIFGNGTAEKVLLYLVGNELSYAQEIADRVRVRLNLVQRQLRRLEEGGVLVARSRGRMHFYSLSPRYAFAPELRALLDKALRFVPVRERARYASRRRRPRRTGKPL